MKTKIKVLLCLLCVLVVGCSSIDKLQAEEIASGFIQEHVKFFAKEGEGTTNLPQYDISSITSYEDNGNWVVVMHITSTVENETKDNDLTVVVDGRGQVIMFNGAPVPR